MNKLVCTITMVVLAVAAIAAQKHNITPAEAKRLYDAMSPEKKAEAHRQMLIHTGGPIMKPAEGKIAVINCQKTIPDEVVAKKVESTRHQLRVNIDKLDGKLEMYNVPEGYAAALYVVDDKSLPLTLYAVEQGWGVMNVAYLEGIEKRFNRLFDRAAVMTFGAAVSMNKVSPLQPLVSAKGLDKLVVDGIPFDCVQAILYNLSKLGVSAERRSMYRKACIDGWAPAPTNEYQKAIWDEIHKLPTKPLKLTDEK